MAIVAACAIALVWAVYFIAAGKAGNDISAAADRQLRIIALDLESALEKFETLPFTLSFHPDVVNALARRDTAVVQRLNLTLQAIQAHSKVAAIYLMDREGNTLASSNWDQTTSFVGRNFRFRPYFLEALAGRAGRFYGIGNTTGEPGYFLAQPVYPLEFPRQGGAPVGVIAVKISLNEFERAWHSSEEPVALADSSGVVFLSNREAWKYHSLTRLDAEAQGRLADTLQYAGRPIQPVSSLSKRDKAGFGEFVAKPVGRLGWQVMLFPSHARVVRVATYSASAAALLLSLAALAYWAVHQRRRRLEERIESRKALQKAAEELDRRIAQRTGELLEANRSLESKYAKLQETEQILRTTQNELVQAGKLAMLGQMAAGVTHELNQPLAAIRAFADNAVTFLERGNTERASENLAQISAASARMGTIISQLKGFARKSRETPAKVDLAQAIRSSAMLLEGDLRRHGVELEVDACTPVEVIGDAVRVEQVLINILRNALDAVEETPSPCIAVGLGREDGEAVIRVRDSGPGIPEQVVQHLFEPFYTTKASGKGLGLGLAISSSIVQAMNGQLTARNHDGGGAEFIVRLPLPEAETNNEGGELANA